MNEAEIKALERKEKELLQRMDRIVERLEAARMEVARLKAVLDRLRVLQFRTIPALEGELASVEAELDPVQDALDVAYGVPERFPRMPSPTRSQSSFHLMDINA